MYLTLCTVALRPYCTSEVRWYLTDTMTSGHVAEGVRDTPSSATVVQ